MFKWISVGTVLQTAMVLAGHWVLAVANLFGILGMAVARSNSVLLDLGPYESQCLSRKVDITPIVLRTRCRMRKAPGDGLV